MASTGINFEQLTPPALTVDSFKQLIWLKTFGVDKIGQLVTVMPNQRHGQKLGFLGSFGLLGKASQGCKPEYDNDLIPAAEKEWDIREWEIAETLCYKDIEGTLAHEALKKQTDIADLTGTDYMNLVLDPKLSEAMENLVQRLVWFGDKDAASAADGGILGADSYVPYFNVIDGFWKRLYQLAASTPARLTAISANDGATWAEQKQAAWANYYACDLLDSLITDADLILRSQNDTRIYITLAFKDALDHDIKNNNKGSELQWEAIFSGITKTNYNGIEIVACPFWDNIIRNYEKNDGSFYKPYRALYTMKDNLLVGTESTAKDGLSYFVSTFNVVDQTNYIIAKDKLGTLTLQDELAQMAF